MRLPYTAVAFAISASCVSGQAQTVSPPISLEGFIQTDLRTFTGDPEYRYGNEFALRRIRIGVSGSVNEFTSFRIIPDLAGNKVILTDAYVELRATSTVRVRA